MMKIQLDIKITSNIYPCYAAPLSIGILFFDTISEIVLDDFDIKSIEFALMVRPSCISNSNHLLDKRPKFRSKNLSDVQFMEVSNILI